MKKESKTWKVCQKIKFVHFLRMLPIDVEVVIQLSHILYLAAIKKVEETIYLIVV